MKKYPRHFRSRGSRIEDRGSRIENRESPLSVRFSILDSRSSTSRSSILDPRLLTPDFRFLTPVSSYNVLRPRAQPFRWPFDGTESIRAHEIQSSLGLPGPWRTFV